MRGDDAPASSWFFSWDFQQIWQVVGAEQGPWLVSAPVVTNAGILANAARRNNTFLGVSPIIHSVGPTYLGSASPHISPLKLYAPWTTTWILGPRSICLASVFLALSPTLWNALPSESWDLWDLGEVRELSFTRILLPHSLLFSLSLPWGSVIALWCAIWFTVNIWIGLKWVF